MCWHARAASLQPLEPADHASPNNRRAVDNAATRQSNKEGYYPTNTHAHTQTHPQLLSTPTSRDAQLVKSAVNLL